jgi:Zn finger protein HypA/HybF involved in hydrogenase expression
MSKNKNLDKKKYIISKGEKAKRCKKCNKALVSYNKSELCSSCGTRKNTKKYQKKYRKKISLEKKKQRLKEIKKIKEFKL